MIIHIGFCVLGALLLGGMVGSVLIECAYPPLFAATRNVSPHGLTPFSFSAPN